MNPESEYKKTGPARGDETRATEPDHDNEHPSVRLNFRRENALKSQAAMAFKRYRDALALGDRDEANDALARYMALVAKGGARK